jgi:tellurite resistance protein TerC
MLLLADIAATSPVLELGFPPEALAVFAVAVALSVTIDLLLHRTGKAVSLASAAAWSAFWVALGLGFYGYLHWRFGAAPADLYLAGYALEMTLSVDNLMVFMAIFSFFNIRGELQHRILYWGILGAMLFRAIFVLAGSLLLYFGAWADTLFGIFVVGSGVMMLRELNSREDDSDAGPTDYNDYMLVRVARRFVPLVPHMDGKKFVVGAKRAAELTEGEAAPLEPSRMGWYMTPALVCLLVIEASDVLFAFDSVPAVIAITREPLLVYASMIFAILGLRSLYFVLSALTRYLVHLEKAVVVLLFFVGFKMLLHASRELTEQFLGEAWTTFDLTPAASLYVIMGVLALGVVVSLLFPGAAEEPTES